jgi:hypothetical protein
VHDVSEETLTVTGGCYCGAVRYRASGVRAQVTECHCSQCRRQSGYRWGSTAAPMEKVEIDGADAITWFSASPSARRGFCSTCGSHLFWEPTNGGDLGILAASVDEPNRLAVAKHIHVADKGCYYEIDDGLPQS